MQTNCFNEGSDRLEGPIFITEESMRILFAEYYSPLCLYALGFLRDRDAARDVIIDLLARVWTRKDSLTFHSGQALKAFLFKSARNATLNRLRDIKAEKRQVEEYEKTLDIKDEEDIQAKMRNEILNAVNYEIGNLSPQYRRVIQMTLNGRSDDEISDELGIAKSSVWVNRMRAIRVLKKRFEGQIPVAYMMVVISFFEAMGSPK